MKITTVNNNLHNQDRNTAFGACRITSYENAVGDAILFVNRQSMPHVCKILEVIRLLLERVSEFASTGETVPELHTALQIRSKEKPLTDPDEARPILSKLLSLLGDTPAVRKVNFELAHAEDLRIAKIAMVKRDADISVHEKKTVITRLFKLKAEGEKLHSKMFSDYIFETLIPHHIVVYQKRELAEHILSITKRPVHQRSVDYIHERMRLLSLLGTPDKNLEELNSYTHGRGQIGVPDFVKRKKPEILDAINQAALAAIEKLTTSPNF